MKRLLSMAIITLSVSSYLFGQNLVETEINNRLLNICISNSDSVDIVLFVSMFPINNDRQEHITRRVFFTRVGDFSLFSYISEGLSFDGFITEEYTFPFVVKKLKPKETFSIFLISTNKKALLSNHLFCVRKKEMEDYLKIRIEKPYLYNKSILLYYFDSGTQ